MLGLLRERRFVDLEARDNKAAEVHMYRDGLEVILWRRPILPYQVGVSSGSTLAEAALNELRRWHRSFLDDLDEVTDGLPPGCRETAPYRAAVATHAARFRALMDVWDVCQRESLSPPN